MINVVFVAPFLMRATTQFIEGVANLPEVHLILLTQDRKEALSPQLQRKIGTFIQAQSVMTVEALVAAGKDIQKRYGPIHRMIGTLEHLQVQLAQARLELGIPGLGPEAACNFRDKAQMKRVLKDQGLPCARNRLIHTAQEARTFIDEVGFPVVVKPCDGAGSRHTYRLDDSTALAELLQQQPPEKSGPQLFEEFIKGDEYTFDSALINGEMVWHSMVRYFPNPLEALRNPWIQLCMLVPRELDHPYFDDIRKAALASVRALGLQTGLSHLEWFRRADGSLAISEVGARPPGGQITSMHGLAYDFDIHKAWASLMVFGTWPKVKRDYAAGTVFLRGMGQGRVKEVRGLDVVLKEIGDMIIETKIPQKGQPTSGTYEGEGYIVIKHPITRVVEKALDIILSRVRVIVG